MGGVALRNLGTTATFAPQMKRATARLSTGQSVLVVPDTNRSGSNGTDTTGTAKIAIYLSTDSTRTAYGLNRTHTPAVAMASSTKSAVMSCTVAENDTLYVVYQGTDNSLRMITFTVTAGSFNAGTEQTVSAATAVTSRFRSVDIDACPTNANIVVGAYESLASSGQGAAARIFVRMNDGTTWTRAYNTQFFTTEFIQAGSEDISVAWNKVGISSNVGQIAFFVTRTFTTGDQGDLLREVSFNVSTGTTDSATVIGSWYTALNMNIAAGSRRAWLFSEVNNQWVFANIVGTTIPFFQAMRIQHNTFTGIIINRSVITTQFTSDRYVVVDRAKNINTAYAADYCDNAVVFGFTGVGVLNPSITRSMVIRFSSTTSETTALGVDYSARVLENGFSVLDGAIGIYGGGNKNLQSGQTSYNFLGIYGATGDSVSASVGVLARYARAITEDTISAPAIISPNSTSSSVGQVQFRVSAQNANLYSNVLGKLQIQIASDTGFTTNLQTITEADSEFQSYSATSSTVPPIRTIVYTLTALQRIVSGTWFARARIADDLGGFSAYSSTVSFTVSHPPTALPVTPANGTTVLYGAGSPSFTWQFSDTEPADTQSAYQLKIVRLDTGASVVDTGKVVSSVKTVAQSISSGLKDIPLQWQVSLWDADDVQGAFSNAIIFTLADAPVGTITAPTSGGSVTTASPTVTWSFSAGGVRTQRAFRIVVTDTGASPDEIVGDTGWVFSNATTYTFPTPILQASGAYHVDLYVQDTAGLQDTDGLNFTTTYTPPAQATATLTADLFKILVAWTNATQDANWIGWRVYRRYLKPASADLDVDATATTWVMVYETVDALTNYSFYDYTAPLNKSVDYIVVQLADRFGSVIESDLGSFSTVTQTGDRYYFIPEIPIGAIASFQANSITGDTFTREIEQNTIHVIGRGRQVQVGDDLGYTGSFTVRLRKASTARLEREFFEYLSGDDAGNVFIKSPFGDVLYVSIGNIATQRIPGSGSSDIVDLTIPYSEVFSNPPIIRTS